MSKPAKKLRTDGWQNRVTGYGTMRDKVRSMLPYAGPLLEPTVLSVLFHYSDLARRIVRKLPEQALRQGFSFVDEGNNAEADDAKKLTQAMIKKWMVKQLVKEAAIWGRLFGGAFIMVGITGAGTQRTPLDVTRVRPGALKFLSVYDRRDVLVHSYYSNPLEPKFGEPEVYRIQPSLTAGGFLTESQAVIHESRMIRFGGAMTAKVERAENASWDHSVLQPVFEVLQQSNANWAAICSLMSDFGQAVVKLQGLIKLIGQHGVDALEERVAQMDFSRSSMRTLLIDADKEEFVRTATPVAGAAELLDQTWQRLATAADMPVTELMEMVPGGLNANGDEQTRAWYDRIVEAREDDVGPAIERLADIIAGSEGISGRDSLSLCWPSLWQQSPGEQSKSRLADSQAVGVLVDKKIVTPSEAAVSMFGRGKYSSDISIDLKAREVSQKKEIARLGEEPPKPTAQPTPAPSP